jgi:glycosyltransferase involved in cell wall biosynthesis
MYICNEGTLGGAAQSLIDMLNGFQNSVRAVVVIPCHGIIEEKFNQLNIKYYVVPFEMGYKIIGTINESDADNNFLDNYCAALKLQNIIVSEKIQLIHVNSSVSNVGAMAALLSGIPYVWHLREVMEEQFGCEFLDNNLKKELLNKSDLNLTISNTVQKCYEEKFGTRSISIYNGLNIPKYMNCIDDVVRQRNQSFIIPGVVIEAKGQFDAIRAVDRLVSRGFKNIKLYIIGSCSEYYGWMLKHYITSHNLGNNIELLPFSSDLSMIRRKCTYAITTSVFEAMGRTTVEAMLAGNIIIGADTAGTKEIIGEDGKRGLLYRQGDVESLTEIMCIAMNMSETKRRAMLAEAQDYAVENFDFEKYDEKVLKIYTDVLEKHKSNDNSEILYELKDKYNHIENKPFVPNGVSINKGQIVNELKETIIDNKDNIKDYLCCKQVKKAAIYGLGTLGCLVYDIFEEAGIEVPYLIDRNSDKLKKYIEVISPDDEIGRVDILIITVVGDDNDLVSLYKNRYPKVLVMSIREFLKEALDN